MRLIDSNTLNALNGSRTGDRITVYAWYNGQLAYADPLPVSAWSMDWDTTRTVQTMTLDVTDKDGKLAPWLLEDPLGVGGTRLQVTYQVGGAGTINMGWYRITQSTPAETWRGYIINNAGQINIDSPIPNGQSLAVIPGGATIHLTADDLGVLISNSRLLAPDSPHGGSPTIIGEVKRLLADIVPVTTTAGVTDRAVNTNLIYKDDRLAAVQDLCHRITCDYRLNGNGQFEVYPITPQTPVWVVKGGPEGALVSVNRDQKIDGLYNIFVADGTANAIQSDGTVKQLPIRGIAQILAGPLRVNGPHGNYPVFYSSTMLTTQGDCDTYAATMRDTQLQGLTTDLTVTCLPNPAIQQGDWVTVASPVVNNQTVTLNGKVKTMHLTSTGNTVAPMTLTVECTYADVQQAMAGVSRG